MVHILHIKKKSYTYCYSKISLHWNLNRFPLFTYCFGKKCLLKNPTGPIVQAIGCDGSNPVFLRAI